MVACLFGAAAALATTRAASAADPIEVQPTPGGVVVEGRPIAAVVITQCSQLVVVYLVMPDGRLLRFDSTTGVPWDRLLAAAYSAVRSERVDVPCGREDIASPPAQLFRASALSQPSRHTGRER